MLLCTQFSEQLKLVSLDMNEKSFEFEPKELAVSEYFNGCYIDAYISKKYNNNPFVIRLFFFDLISSEWYSYFFIIKNNKLVNFEIPWDSPDFEKITEGSGRYYKVKGSYHILLKDKLLNEIIAKNNLTTKDVSAFDSIDMKSLKMTLKFELESGSIVTWTGECKGTLSEKSTFIEFIITFTDSGTGWCCCLKGKKSTEGAYRYMVDGDFDNARQEQLKNSGVSEEQLREMLLVKNK
ncbi:hypothetical protein BdWA1_003344 [Babesia duncani]|uniref:Uncharacterized protein n=1 Tax=Babesia duncani TaxID=323732 RepID=A0AAD9PGZ1_9APIC|nr:hypothetical protein BdWA1_003856 [Babesia duncani]KAK2195044.1 hypothetical protein BdWA1_003344 [Babesia duncani]